MGGDRTKEKLKKFWKWLRKEFLNRKMFVWFIIAEIIFWSPCIVGAILGVLIDPWFYTICVTYIAFWSLPLTPAIPLQIGLAYGLKKLADAVAKRRARRKKKGEENNADQR